MAPGFGGGNASPVRVTREQNLVTITVSNRVMVQFWTRTEHDAMAIVGAFQGRDQETEALRKAYADGVSATMDAVADGGLEYSRYRQQWSGLPPDENNYLP